MRQRQRAQDRSESIDLENDQDHSASTARRRVATRFEVWAGVASLGATPRDASRSLAEPGFIPTSLAKT